MQAIQQYLPYLMMGAIGGQGGLGGSLAAAGLSSLMGGMQQRQQKQQRLRRAMTTGPTREQAGLGVYSASRANGMLPPTVEPPADGPDLDLGGQGLASGGMVNATNAVSAARSLERVGRMSTTIPRAAPFRARLSGKFAKGGLARAMDKQRSGQHFGGNF